MPVIALDLGGTKLAAALLSNEGDLLFIETAPLEKRNGPEVCHLILQQANDLIKKAANENITVSSLGICVPGIAYTKTGRTKLKKSKGIYKLETILYIGFVFYLFKI